ncbi:retrograde regulation protein 2 [Exophiala viscosa]|uniref:Retrograde regulation protein 2 n=1 Tax=Exophiala viscosa TaxID=2486360 RepID=A0AAN6DN94_9EURO|nr:retrograde regulation protein 2 [Exophiala viscosa]
MADDTKTHISLEEHTDNVEVQTSQVPSKEELQAQKSLLWKLDLVILPLLSLSYLLAYMDRNNVGYSRLMGLQKALKLSDKQFYNVVMVFCEKLGPKIVLGFAVTSFGIFVCCMSKARGYGDLIGLRFGIGAAEALLQSAPLYLSIWYGRDELGKRIAIFYSATTISGVFSGLIAYGVQKGLEGTDGRASWQWLFLIEGVIAVAVGLANAALLPNFPDRMETSRFISELETKVAWQRSQEYNAKSVRFESSQIIKSLLDPKTYLLALLAGCNSTLLAATGAFLPTIVVGFGYSKIQSQLFTIIPYACSFFSMLAVGYLSDFYRNKSWFILGSLTSCAIGLIVLISSTGKQVGMFGTSLLVAGAYPAAVLQITWIQITFCGNTKRAISWGVAMIVGQGLSMSAAQIYTTPPRFFEGHGILLGFVVMGMVCTVAARFLMARANKQTDQELREYEERGQEHPGVGKSFEEVCDNHINFRYSL